MGTVITAAGAGGPPPAGTSEPGAAASRGHTAVVASAIDAALRANGLDDVCALLVHALPENLKCCACWDLVQNAKAFACGHSACGGCADRVMADSGKCPFCRKRSRDGGALPPNFMVRGIVDELRVKCPYACAIQAPTVPSSSTPSTCAPMELQHLDAHLRNACAHVVVGLYKLNSIHPAA